MTTTDGALLENLLLLPQLLRRLGVPVSLEQSLAFVRAIDWIGVSSRRRVYHAGRCLLVSRREDLRLYDVLFHRLFGRHRALEPRRSDRRDHSRRAAAERRRPHDLETWLAARAGAADPELEVADRSATFSPSEVLQHKEFSSMTPEELRRIERLISSLRWRMSERRTRRLERGGRRGRLDLRRALRQAASHGGGMTRLFWRQRRIKERPVVLLADISGSMETVSRLVLQLFFSITQRLKSVETFVFGTRLSRITPQLRLRNVDRALDEASRQVLDWAGGTRIGECLRDFNRRWARRVLRRGAVVVVVSDGWERGDVELLRREIRHLQRRSHRLVWLNPLLGRAGYEPRVEGMAAALPYVDDFLPIHNLRSLEELRDHLASLPARRGARRQPAGGRTLPARAAGDAKPFPSALRIESATDVHLAGGW
jgi:hypothetical protein